MKKAQDPKDQDVIEELWNLEEEWDTTLKKIDALLCPQENVQIVTKIGEKAPLDAVLQNARNPQESTTLREVLSNANSAKVHLVLLRHLS